MTDPATGQRSFLQALKVPFDLKGVAAGMLAYLALVLGARSLGGGFYPQVFVRDLLAGPSPSGWELGMAGSWPFLLQFLVVVMVFGVACCRIAGMRLARDEGVDFFDALAFAVKGIPATLGAWLFAAAAAGLFFGCNALAGLVVSIPVVGPFLTVLLVPLVLLSALLLFLILFGTVLGFPLVHASLAVERNGPLDAVSRAFSYVFGRPALFFFYAFTVYFVCGVLVASAGALEGLWAWSFSRGFPAWAGWEGIRWVFGEACSAATALRAPDFGEGLFRAAPTTAAAFGGWVCWGAGLLLHLTLWGWIVYYVFGGFTAAYFALRRDVDGTEDEEIWVEGEDREKFGEPERPEPVSASSPPPATANPPGAEPGAKP